MKITRIASILLFSLSVGSAIAAECDPVDEATEDVTYKVYNNEVVIDNGISMPTVLTTSDLVMKCTDTSMAFTISSQWTSLRSAYLEQVGETEGAEDGDMLVGRIRWRLHGQGNDPATGMPRPCISPCCGCFK